MSHHSLYRDPALEAEHRGWVAYDQQDAGHLVLPDGSLISTTDHAFLTAAAPYVYAAHLAARSGGDGEPVVIPTPVPASLTSRAPRR